MQGIINTRSNAHQSPWIIWITRKIYCDVPTHITSPRGFVTTKKDRNVYRIYLNQKTFISQTIKERKQHSKTHIKNNPKVIPVHAWNEAPAWFLSPTTCSETQQNEFPPSSTRKTQIAFSWLHIDIWHMHIDVQARKFVLFLISPSKKSVKRKGVAVMTYHMRTLKFNRKGNLNRTLCFYHLAADNFPENHKAYSLSFGSYSHPTRTWINWNATIMK